MPFPPPALFLLFLALIAAPAQARQDAGPVRQAVEDFLSVQTKGLPGEASYTVGAIEADNNLAPCSALEAAWPAGSRSYGKTTVQVRCRAGAAWSLYVPVQIRVVTDYVVAAHPLAAGQILSAQALGTQRGDLAELPAGVLTDPQQAIGRSLGVGMAAGRPLRSDMLRQPVAVQQGQSVKIVTRGAGFLIATEGRALNNAADGQVVQARIPSGRTLSGIARAGGTIEIAP